MTPIDLRSGKEKGGPGVLLLARERRRIRRERGILSSFYNRAVG